MFVVLIPTLFVLSFRLYMVAHSSDIEPVDDTDLLLVRPDIPTTNNAYQIFASATNLLCLPDEYDLEGYLWGDTNDVGISQVQITSLLESHKMLIATMSDGCRKDYCFRTPPMQLPTLVSEFTQMHLVLLAKVKSQMECGHINEAFNTALSSLRFGYLVHKDAEYIVEALAGVSMIYRSLTYIEKITDQHLLPSEKMTELITELSQLENLRNGLENGYKSEYSFAANEMIDQLYTVRREFMLIRVLAKIKGRGYVFKPNATKKILAERWRWQINKLHNPDSVPMQHDAREYRLPKGIIQKTLFLLGENSVGKIFLSLTTACDLSGVHKELWSTEKKATALKAKLLLRRQEMGGL